MKDITVRSKLSSSNKGRIKSKEECRKISIGKSKSKGGVCKKDIPLYDTFSNNLSLVEDTNFIINIEGMKVLQVKCSYCNKWFIPTQSQCENRVQFIRGHTDRESRFYCSDMCKALCPVFFKRKWPTGYNPRKHRNKINESDLRVWSKEVLKRADYVCEYCENPATEAHHIQPKKLEPFFALDPDNGIACCEKCHYKYGHKNECSFVFLASIECVQHD
jgi:5-methylcytosine-specific restriction endonuclease McrA